VGGRSSFILQVSDLSCKSPRTENGLSDEASLVLALFLQPNHARPADGAWSVQPWIEER
jgi:hypothetical protein